MAPRDVTPRPSTSPASSAQQPSAKPTGVTKLRNAHTAKRRKTHPKVLGTPKAEAYYTMRQSHLLSLPAELRRMIWEYALTSDTGILLFDPSTNSFDVSTIGAGLLTTSHFLAVETQFLPLQFNSLVFGHDKGGERGAFSFLRFMSRITDVEAKLGCILRFKAVHIGPSSRSEAGLTKEILATTRVGITKAEAGGKLE